MRVRKILGVIRVGNKTLTDKIEVKYDCKSDRLHFQVGNLEIQLPRTEVGRAIL